MLELVSSGFRGAPVHFGTLIVDADGEHVDEIWADDGVVRTKLAPGLYSVRIDTEIPGFERTIRDVSISETSGFARKIDFASGEIVFGGRERLTAIFREKNTGNVAEKGIDDENRSCILPEGEYELAVTLENGEEVEYGGTLSVTRDSSTKIDI